MATQRNLFWLDAQDVIEQQAAKTRLDTLRVQAALKHSTGKINPLDQVRQTIVQQAQGRVNQERSNITNIRESALKRSANIGSNFSGSVSEPRSIGPILGPIQEQFTEEQVKFSGAVSEPRSRGTTYGPKARPGATPRTDAMVAFANYDPEAEVWGRKMGSATDKIAASQGEFQFGSKSFINEAKQLNSNNLAMRKTAGRFNVFSSKLDKVNSILDQALVNSGMNRATGGYFLAGTGATNPVRRIQGGMAGAIHKFLRPEENMDLISSIMKQNDGALAKATQAASLTGDTATLDKVRQGLGTAMREGTGRFSPRMGTRAIWAMGSSIGKGTAQVGMVGLKGANALSKVALGANLGQVGAAAAAVAGLGYMAGSALGISREQAGAAVNTVHEFFKQASKSVYGRSDIGQSTQGLVFGLNNRRHG
jgi:hypothetical protein